MSSTKLKTCLLFIYSRPKAPLGTFNGTYKKLSPLMWNERPKTQACNMDIMWKECPKRDVSNNVTSGVVD